MTRTVRSIKHLSWCLVMLGLLAITPIYSPEAAAAQYETTVTFSDVQVTSSGITLKGTVLNSGWGALYRAQVVLWVDERPISTKAQLVSALNANPELDVGDRILQKGSITTIAMCEETFDAGQAAEFTVTATWKQMGLSADAVYMVGVHVRGSDEPWGSQITIGRGRTLVTLATSTAATTATVVMLTSAPSLLTDNVFINDNLVTELKGRLSTLLSLAGMPRVSWVIDPALFHEIQTMAAGYTIWDGTVSVDGTGQQIAQDWLNRFQALDRANGYRLPWGNPDLALGLTTETDLITASKQAELANPELMHLPLLIRAANGQADESFLNYIAPLNPDIVLAEATTNVSLTHGRLLNTLATPFPGGPGPDDPDTTVQRLQRAIAENAVGDPLIRVIQTDEEAKLLYLPTWVTTVSLASIPAIAQWPTNISTGQPVGTLTAEVLKSMKITSETIRRYADLIGDDEAAQVLTTVPIAAIPSQSWADDAAAAQYAAAVDQWLKQIMGKVTITASAEVSLTSRTTTFPVTVTNDLDIPVFVRVSTRVVSVQDSPALVSIPRTDVLEIRPGARLTVYLTAQILREGEVDATLSLTTPSGTSLDSQVVTRLKARASAWMGYAVMISAFVLFAVGTFLRVRSAKRKGKPSE